MIIRNFYRNKNERLKLRKRYKLKNSLKNSRETKYIVYVFRSNKHCYITFLHEGKIHASANTIKHKRNSSEKPCQRYHVLNTLVEEFFEKVISFFGKEKTVCVSQFLFDISYYRYSGSVKKIIDYFRQLVQEQFK